MIHSIGIRRFAMLTRRTVDDIRACVARGEIKGDQNSIHLSALREWIAREAASRPVEPPASKQKEPAPPEALLWHREQRRLHRAIEKARARMRAIEEEQTQWVAGRLGDGVEISGTEIAEMLGIDKTKAFRIRRNAAQSIGRASSNNSAAAARIRAAARILAFKRVAEAQNHVVRKVLANIEDPRLADVIVLRYGLDGNPARTYRAIADQIQSSPKGGTITGTTASYFEHRALRILRFHPETCLLAEIEDSNILKLFGAIWPDLDEESR